MEITRTGERPTKVAGPEAFTGHVTHQPIIRAPAPARIRSLVVTFAPGARTHWHHHPIGQTLYVLSGIGRIQKQGEPLHEIRPGDTVWIAPGEVHWHGAAPDHAMVHIAMQEEDEGSGTVWLHPVSDADASAPVA
ncbi:MAG: cupin domain-containing protein [Pseudomonadota bacterium]